MKLSEEMSKWRADRPDEWKMDEFIRKAKRMEYLFNLALDTVAEAGYEGYHKELKEALGYNEN